MNVCSHKEKNYCDPYVLNLIIDVTCILYIFVRCKFFLDVRITVLNKKNSLNVTASVQKQISITIIPVLC